MGWLQLKRWLSFLPVAFVVYILLHYFVYQPDLSGPHAALLVSGRRSNESVVSVAGGRTLQSGPRVLPPLAQDTVQPELSLTSDLLSSKEPPSAAEGTSGRRNDNATLSQGVAGESAQESSPVRTPPSSTPTAVKTQPNQQQQQVGALQTTRVVPQTRHVVTKKTLIKKTNISASNLAVSALKGSVKVGDKYESGFSVPHEELCENNGRELKVLVLITTAPDHGRQRTAVRQTWGHFTIRKDVVIAFVIGRTTNANIQSNVDKENELYGDIIQANFIDHYNNLTLKTVSMFEWVKTYCSESHFILKTDDDMFINMPLLLTFIDSKINDRRVMYGRMAKGWKPVRIKKSKYYIDVNTYNKSKYPDFLTGPAYLFTGDVVDEIYQKALNTTYFMLEDVLVTGFVSETLKIRRIGDSRFKNEKFKRTDTCTLMKTISTHMVKYEEQFDFYKRTLDGKAKCKAG
ncbi:beta-1,3-galactosyltransferase 5-like isoform X2 [Panulirus ornatus]